jgi:acyltransferase-like protein
VFEVLGLLCLFGLWVISGFGLRMRSERMVTRNFAFMRWWLRGINGLAQRLFRLRIWIEDRPVPRPGPILVFPRHAGPGNSMLIIGTLLIGYGREPRIVMLAKLQWEPLFDVMLNRLPNRFIRHDPSKRDVYTRAIAELSSGMNDRGAFVLFPEGKDFTQRVRSRAIEYLRSKGHGGSADRAERMRRVLPPRHNGVLAAIEAAPDADVVLVAHSVLEDVGSFGELWSRIPLDRRVTGRYWRIPSGEVPRDQEALIEWLYAWWERIDAWIEDRNSLAEAITSQRGGSLID